MPGLQGAEADPLDPVDEAEVQDYVVFEVDFDSKKDVLRTLNVQKQSTLIAYSGTKEVGRSTGDTDAASIEALLAKAI